MTGVSTALGPLLGGYLVGAVSWRAVFLINVPIGAFVIASARHVPETRDPDAHGRPDIAGAVLIFLALAGSTYALIEAPNGGSALAVAATATLGALALVAFVLVERRSAAPMLPLKIFSAQFTYANIVTFVVYAALGGVFFLLVSFLQISLGYSPLAAGAASLPVTLLMLLFSARSGALAQRIGPRLQLALGPLIVAAGVLMMAQIEPGDNYLTGILPSQLVFGVGLTLVVSPITATVLASASERHAGIASGVNNAVARVGSLIAVAVLPVIAGLTGERFYVPHAMTHGFHVAMFACAGLVAAGGVLAWFTIDNDIVREPAKEEHGVTEPIGFSCGVNGPPLRPAPEPDEPERPEPAASVAG
jgi:MFS family permease